MALVPPYYQVRVIGIFKTSGHTESVRCYDAIFWAVGSCIISEPIGVHPGNLYAPNSLYSVAVTLVRIWVLLRLFYQEQFHHHRFVRPQLCELNLSWAILVVFFLVLAWIL